MFSRKVRVGSGVAPGAKTFFMALRGKAGEKTEGPGLSLAAEARKMFRVDAAEGLPKLPDGTPSRDANRLRREPKLGVPLRQTEPAPKGEGAAEAGLAGVSAGRA